MRLRDLLPVLVLAGVGFVPTPAGDLAVCRSRCALAGPTLTPGLRAGIKEHKAALVGLLNEGAVRRTWRMPRETPVGPQLLTILAWLGAERASFTSEEWRVWLASKTALIDASTPSYVADILATEQACRRRLAPDVESVAREAA